MINLGCYIYNLRLLITFLGAVCKMFHMCVIFGGTMDNDKLYLWKGYEIIDVRFAELPTSVLHVSLTSKQTALYRSALNRLSKCVRHFGSFYWFRKKKGSKVGQ